jgi:hypothetical protein
MSSAVSGPDETRLQHVLTSCAHDLLSFLHENRELMGSPCCLYVSPAKF